MSRRIPCGCVVVFALLAASLAVSAAGDESELPRRRDDRPPSVEVPTPPLPRRSVTFADLFEQQHDAPAVSAPPDFLVRRRERVAEERDEWRVAYSTRSWDFKKTAVVVCDMWDDHSCQSASRRVGELAPRVDEFLWVARRRGALIIHCPSDCMDFYTDTPQRKRALEAPVVESPAPLEGWRRLDPEREGPLPIDDSDGGCDCQPQCPQIRAWKRQHPAIEIFPEDAITDSAEAYYLMRQRGIENVLVLGVHANMFVLGRPFSIRQLVAQKLNVMLVRDLTDSMYNPRRAPHVPHVRGTELVVEHIEKYWCPTILSTDLTRQPRLRLAEDDRPRVVFAVSENECRPQETLAQLADELEREAGCATDFALVFGQIGVLFQGLEALDGEADLLVLATQQVLLYQQEKERIQAFLARGGSVLGLRTAISAFASHRGLAPESFAAWDEFGRDVLGGHFAGSTLEGTRVEFLDLDHPLLAGVRGAKFESPGSLYKIEPLAEGTNVLARGAHRGWTYPAAWTRTLDSGSRVVYTSLGTPDDFDEPAFRRFLRNAVEWTLKREEDG